MWRSLGALIRLEDINCLDLSEPVCLLDSDQACWRSARISLFRSISKDEENVEEELRQGLHSTASWIAQNADRIETISASDIRAELLLDLWVDADQMELVLPVNLLAACHRANLPVHMISND